MVIQVITGLVAFLAAVASIAVTDRLRRRSARANALFLLAARLKQDKFHIRKTENVQPGDILYVNPGDNAYLEWILRSGILDPKGDGKLISKILDFSQWLASHGEYVRIANLKMFFKPIAESRVDQLTLDATNNLYKAGYELYSMLQREYHIEG